MPTKFEVVVRPHITEKTSAAYQDRTEYTFEVHPDATKQQIRLAIEQSFDPTPQMLQDNRWGALSRPSGWDETNAIYGNPPTDEESSQ